MSLSTFVTKRKLNAAVKLAREDRKISDKPFEVFTWYGEVLLFWSDRMVSAVVRVRSDGTIFVGHEQSHENIKGFLVFTPR